MNSNSPFDLFEQMMKTNSRLYKQTLVVSRGLRRVCFDVQELQNSSQALQEEREEVKRRLEEAMGQGLAKETHQRASLKMLPTYVRATPDGTGEPGLN